MATLIAGEHTLVAVSPAERPARSLPDLRCLALTAAIILVGAGLRAFWLDKQSLSFDETYSAYVAGLPLAQAGRELVSGPLAVSDVPLYYLLLLAWSRLAGSSDFALRYLSLTVGVASLPLLYAYLRSGRVGRLAALFGTALLATAAYHVYFSQEARMHALACFLCLLAAYSLYKAFRHSAKRWWIVYALAAAASPYAFYYAGLVVLALNLPLLLRRRCWSWQWSSANLAVVVACLPWVWLALPRALALVPGRVGYIAPPRLPVFLAETAVSLAYGSPNINVAHALAKTPAVAPAVALAIVLLAGAWRVLNARDLWSWQVVSFALAPVFGLYLLALRVPAFNPRYLLPAFPGLVALLVAGWWRWRTWRPASIAALAVLASAVAGIELANIYTTPLYQRDDFRGALAAVRDQVVAGEALVYDGPQQFTVLAHYFGDRPLPAAGLPVAANPANRDARLLGVWSHGDWEATQVELEQLTAGYGGLWALYYGESQPRVQEWLDGRLLRVASTWYSSDVHLVHYRARPQPAGYSLPGGARVAKQFGPLRLEQLKLSLPEGGSRLEPELAWTAQAPVTNDYSVSLQVFDATGRRVAQRDGPPLGGAVPTSSWDAAHVYLDHVPLHLASRSRAPYVLEVAVYAGGQLAGPQQEVAHIAGPLQRDVAAGAAAAAGWTVTSVGLGSDGAGHEIVSVEGIVQRAPDANYTWFAHALDSAGRLVTQDDHPPLTPTGAWQAGDGFSEVFVLSHNPAAASLEIGAYDAAGKRATFTLTDGSTADHVVAPLGPR